MLLIYLVLILIAPVRHRTLCKRRLRGEIHDSIAEITVGYLLYGCIFSGLAVALLLNSFGPGNCGAAGGGALVLAFLPVVVFIPVVALRSLGKLREQG